jgi:hypothetical protein
MSRNKLRQINHRGRSGVDRLIEPTLRKHAVKREKHKHGGKPTETFHGEVKALLDLLLMAFYLCSFPPCRSRSRRGARFGLDEFRQPRYFAEGPL